MRKFLHGLFIATIAFLCGVAAVGVFNFKKEIVSNPPVTEIVVQLPLNKVEPLPAPSMFEENIEEDFQDEIQNENVFSGWYSLDDFGEMSEAPMIVLGRDYGSHERSEEIVADGGILASSGKDGEPEFFSASSVTINNNQAKFRTAKIKGIEYRFEGTFFKNKKMGEVGEKILRGTLKKYKKGKKIAEISGDFAYYEPHCWH